jgi:enamine deaminase RidA (YjgF/YER057c/UK114 family)
LPSWLNRRPANAMSPTERRAVEARGPWSGAWGYARAVQIGDRVEVSGTTAIGPDGQVVSPGDAYAQTRFVLGVIEDALNELGAGLEDVARTRAFLKNINDWREVGRAHREVFGSVLPASSCVGGVDLLDPALLVEIEAMAIVTGPENSSG